MSSVLITALAKIIKDPKMAKGLIKTLNPITKMDGKKLSDASKKILQITTIKTPFQVAITNINAQIDSSTAEQLAEATNGMLELLQSESVQTSIQILSLGINKILELVENLSNIIARIEIPGTEKIIEFFRGN